MKQFFIATSVIFMIASCGEKAVESERNFEKGTQAAPNEESAYTSYLSIDDQELAGLKEKIENSSDAHVLKTELEEADAPPAGPVEEEKSFDEKAAELNERIKQLKAQKALLAAEKAVEDYDKDQNGELSAEELAVMMKHLKKSNHRAFKKKVKWMMIKLLNKILWWETLKDSVKPASLPAVKEVNGNDIDPVAEVSKEADIPSKVVEADMNDAE